MSKNENWLNTSEKEVKLWVEKFFINEMSYSCISEQAEEFSPDFMIPVCAAFPCWSEQASLY